MIECCAACKNLDKRVKEFDEKRYGVEVEE